MPLPVMTWRQSDEYAKADYSNDWSDPKNVISDVRDMINADVAAYPVSHIWEVNDFDASEAHVELRSTASTIPDFRFLIAGGESVFARYRNVADNAAMTWLYCSDTAATTGPDFSYQSAWPYTSRQCGGNAGVYAHAAGVQNFTHMRYYECDDIILIVLYSKSAAGASYMMGGAIAQKWDTEARVFGVMGPGSGNIATDHWNNNSDTIGTFFSGGTGTYSTISHSKALIINSDDGNAQIETYRNLIELDARRLISFDQQTTILQPIHLLTAYAGAQPGHVIGTARQMLVGPNRVSHLQLNVGGTPRAYTIGNSIVAASDTLYLSNF